ncbi:MAG TPA: hypothetical protein VGQ00_02395 [Candidatus Norongarragalinales archaeon]|jgi:hypothetical protein|nr:hypothetical protein [Candidatus Norongarragalinales archaeon]
MILPLFSIIDDIVNIFTYAWWVWLAILAFYLYRWARDHLPFSPTIALIVGGLLIYYLVIEHPIIGTIGILGWIIISTSLIYVIPLTFPFFRLLTPKKPQ